MNAEINYDSPTLPIVRAQVKNLLTNSSAFGDLPPDKKRQLANDMVKVAHYIVGGKDGESVPTAAQLADNDKDKFDADAAKSGADQFTNLVSGVNFPDFVSKLVQGVFQAIVDSSIQQMEAYTELVKNVAKSVDQYMKDNVSENQARDYLVERYPDHLELDLNGEQPKVKTKEGYNESNMPDFFADLGLSMPMDSLDDDTVEEQLVPAARQRMAMDRQQLLATMVMMGINRLVVTNGSLKAKVVFDLKTTDFAKRTAGTTYNQTATQTEDYARRTRPSWWKRWTSGYSSDTDYTKNLVVETVNTSETSDEDTRKVEMKANLMGDVNINFKSETFPLEKMTNILGFEDLQERYTKTGKKEAEKAKAAQGAA